MQVSIIFGHYAETYERMDMAIQCLVALQQFRDKDTQIIVSANGLYGNIFNKYADIYIERPLDESVGRTMNLGIKAALGNIFFFMPNDNLLLPGAVQTCIDIIKTHPKHLVSPMYLPHRKYHELPMVDGFCVNQRVGCDTVCMTRKQFEDIGWFDEMMLVFDSVNYMNRWIAKGYTTILTPKIMALDVGRKTTHTEYRSYLGQAQKIGFKGYHSKRAFINPTKEEVYKLTLTKESPLWQTL